MNSADINNPNASATTSPSAPPSRPSTTATTEAEYLQLQVNDAKAALSQVTGEIGQSLAQGLNPAAWTRHHPWLAISTTALAAFVATKVATSPSRPSSEPSRPPRTQKRKKKKPSLTWRLLKPLVDMARPALLAALNTALASHAAQPEPTPEPEPIETPQM